MADFMPPPPPRPSSSTSSTGLTNSSLPVLPPAAGVAVAASTSRAYSENQTSSFRNDNGNRPSASSSSSCTSVSHSSQRHRGYQITNYNHNHSALHNRHYNHYNNGSSIGQSGDNNNKKRFHNHVQSRNHQPTYNNNRNSKRPRWEHHERPVASTVKFETESYSTTSSTIGNGHNNNPVTSMNPPPQRMHHHQHPNSKVYRSSNTRISNRTSTSRQDDDTHRQHHSHTSALSTTSSQRSSIIGGRVKFEQMVGGDYPNLKRRSNDTMTRASDSRGQPSSEIKVKIEEPDGVSNATTSASASIPNNPTGAVVKLESNVPTNGTVTAASRSSTNNPPTVVVKSEPNESSSRGSTNSNITPNCTNKNSVAYEESRGKETHIIFAIDFSGSMKRRDVQKGSGCITRWDAVFDCIPIILDGQSSGNNSSKNSNDDNDLDTVVVSLLIFNNEAQTLLESMPLTGDGHDVRQALKRAHKDNKPNGGTGFSAGLERAKAIASGDYVTLVFLSDGRPGDLRSQAPTSATEPMQTTFKQKKKNYPAAGVHIEDMKRNFGNRFNLQIVCLSDEGKPWLEYLAQRYDGSFYMSELKMEDDTMQNRQQQNVVATTDGSDNNNSSDDDEIQSMGVKSQETLIREKYKRALAAGNVHSIARTATSTMRSTFQSISSTVTAMRNGSSNARLRERQVTLESATNPSAMITFRATRMILDPKKEKFIVVSGEAINGKNVSVAMQPFAQGGLRNVFRLGKEFGSRELVGKESRHEVPYAQRLKFHHETSMCQDRASYYAPLFHRKLKKIRKMSNMGPIQVHFLRAEVYRLNDQNSPGGFRYLSVEAKIKGKYEKWNGNEGYVHASNCEYNQVAQAFSHFSYEHSEQEEMVVDIQGSRYTYTDPQLHSKKKEYGRADRGSTGFEDFFKTHKCGFICKQLHLNNRSTVAVKSENKP